MFNVRHAAHVSLYNAVLINATSMLNEDLLCSDKYLVSFVRVNLYMKYT